MPETRTVTPRRAIWSIDEQALAWLDAANHTRLLSEQAAALTGKPAAAAPAGNVKGDIAVIGLYGMITPFGSPILQLLGLGGGGLAGFRACLRNALSNEEIGAIVIDIDSQGGLVDMVPETAAEIRASRGQKPIVAVANTMAASAAYYLASQADEVVVTKSGMVGSIGVLLRHDDMSGRLEQMGVKTTLIYAGKYKTEANPFEPLSDAAKEHLQSEVDELYGMFVTDVAAGRGVNEQKVEQDFGQGRVLLAEDALQAGLVDRIESFEDVIARLGGDVDDEGDEGAEASAAGGLFGSAGERGAEAMRTLEESRAKPEAHAIPAHSTPTDDSKPFTGPKFETYIQGTPAEVDRKMRQYSAWESEDYKRPKPKVAFKFGHHFVSSDGTVGAASIQACRNNIAVLNGARGGTNIPASDRQGVYDHHAKHLRDAGITPPPLKGTGSASRSARRRERRREAEARRQEQMSAEQRRKVLDVLLG